MTWKAEKHTLKSRQVYFERGDKAGRLLALQLRQQSAEQMIPAVDTDANSVLHSPQVINDQFRQYLRHSISVRIHSFLDSLEILKLSLDAQSFLEQPLWLEEIANAIKLSRTGYQAQMDSP